MRCVMQPYIFFNSCILDDKINATNIVLIPKVPNPVSVTDFRPISLCNVLYKLISKVLANRLNGVLPVIISSSQSAFIPGRLIFWQPTKPCTLCKPECGANLNVGLKLDMSKAYNRVEWTFLEAIMWKLGFDARWIRLVMVCVRSVSYSVVVNGKPMGNIKPARGIRQGDPISPYLFLLCAESLSLLIQHAVNSRVLTGVPTSLRGLRLNHLFFADNSMSFCKANSVEWRRLFKILGIYEAGSGQKINIQKTTIFFSRNTSAEKREEILSLSGLTEANRIDIYLGLLCLVGESRVQAFNSIKDRIWRKLQDWKVKFLSQAGKEILLKAMIQAIPTYNISVLQLPITQCREINSMMQHFLWGHMSKKLKIAWLSWEKMGRAKSYGGLSFRDQVMFNKALLAKQG